MRKHWSPVVAATSLLLLLLLRPMPMIVLQADAALTGAHVCHRVDNYTVKTREQYVEPVEILTLAWCLQIPPRCPQTHTELRQRWRMKTEVKYKTVPVCCEGYKVQELVGNGSADAKCVPQCKKCRSGVCTAPDECTCDPGFQGQDCAYECPQGTWGQSCENECSCLREVACNPVSGKCECPPGWTGPRCESKCPEGQWGAGCNSICLCDSPEARCHHETGECAEPEANNAPVDPFEASGIAGIPVPAKQPDYVDIIDFDKEPVGSMPVLPGLGDDSVTPAVPSLPDELAPVQRRPPTTEGPAAAATSPLPSTEGKQLSQPPKRGEFDFDERRTNFRVIVSPKTEYVKNTREGGGPGGEPVSSIPIDVAAMIVVGALVSLGLTSVAVLMLFQVRSRLLKAALSMYSQEKADGQLGHDKDNGPASSLGVTIGTLPRGTLTRVNPVYNAGMDAGPAILTFEERPVEYANGTVTIGIRLSSNFRDFLESHYDKPAGCSGRQAPMVADEADVEHVYDEIPLTAPFCIGKYT